MAILGLALASNLSQPQPHQRGSTHRMLMGINQTVFLRQWGMPEINISLDRLRQFFKLDFLSFDNDFMENDPLTAWVYEKMDMFVLFRRGTLISHFKWSVFNQRFKRPEMEISRQEDDGIKSQKP